MAKPKKKSKSKAPAKISDRLAQVAARGTKKAANASAVVKGKTKKSTIAAIGLGKKAQAPRKASIKDIRRKGITLFKRANSALARFIALRYSAKAIAKYQDYGLRLRRSKRLRGQVVEIDAATYRIKGYIIRTDTAGNNPYSCTCPDFSQFTNDDRNWLGSKAGPFNPCKHMMAVRDRAIGGKWICSGGVCTRDPLATTGFNTKAECEASRNISPVIGGQCQTLYNVFASWELYSKITGNTIGTDSKTLLLIGPISSSYPEIEPSGLGSWYLYGKCDRSFIGFNSSSENALRNLSVTVARVDGLPDNCGNPPIYCSGEIGGCTNPSAPNYNPNATIDDGNCGVSGCTDPLAPNYNPDATCDNGSCDPYVAGCTDPAANNYNPSATVDDGSCTY